MPELPEVETVRNALNPHCVGKRIKRIDTFSPTLRYPLDQKKLNLAVGGKIITSLSRRAKYLILNTETSDALLMHLGMTGSFNTGTEGEKRGKHEHIRLVLESNQIIRYTDPRRFGFILPFKQLPGDPSHDRLARLGVEPQSENLNETYLFKASRGRKVSVKNFLLNQDIIAGIGNIYASEALFESRVKPTRRAETLKKKECNAICASIKNVLQRSIEAGGSTISDFRSVDGSEGKYSLSLNVYGKTSHPCPECRTPILRIVQSNRSTFLCPRCQR